MMTAPQVDMFEEHLAAGEPAKLVEKHQLDEDSFESVLSCVLEFVVHEGDLAALVVLDSDVAQACRCIGCIDDFQSRHCRRCGDGRQSTGDGDDDCGDANHGASRHSSASREGAIIIQSWLERTRD